MKWAENERRITQFMKWARIDRGQFMKWAEIWPVHEMGNFMVGYNVYNE
jgi:hypothetical protein